MERPPGADAACRRRRCATRSTSPRHDRRGRCTWTTTRRGSETVGADPRHTQPQSSDDVMRTAAAMIRARIEPVAIVGVEARSTMQRRCSPRSSVSVARCLTTYQAIGVVPEGHPQQAGLFTSGADRERRCCSRPTSSWRSGSIRSSRCRHRGATTCPWCRCRRCRRAPRSMPISVEVIGPLARMLDRVVVQACTGWQPRLGCTGAR